MNLILRRGAGRGEFELAGKQNNVQVTDVLGLPILIEILPGIEINAHAKCLEKEGKPRIRSDAEKRYSHPAYLIASAMLMPRPKRAQRECHGDILLERDKYVVRTIRLDIVKRPGALLIRPVIVRIENADGLGRNINYSDRMEQVLRVWTAAAKKADELSESVRNHCAAFTSITSSQSDLVNAFKQLHEALGKPVSDLLPILEGKYSVGDYGDNVTEKAESGSDEDSLDENIIIDPAMARAERVRQLRLASARGHASSVFRSDVRDAYDSRCMFSGQRLPRTAATNSAGVDAAHILPWSLYDLDSVTNGLCLNKQCHWALDAGLFRLNFHPLENSYVLKIPESVEAATTAAEFDLAYFSRLSGVIPRNHLPQDEKFWPSPKYLKKLNEFLDDDAA